MKNQFLAVTYDVCEAEDLYIDMNEYVLSSELSMDDEVTFYAQQDIAPVVKVYKISDSSLVLHKEYHFAQYECHCTKEV